MPKIGFGASSAIAHFSVSIVGAAMVGSPGPLETKMPSQCRSLAPLRSKSYGTTTSWNPRRQRLRTMLCFMPQSNATIVGPPLASLYLVTPLHVTSATRLRLFGSSSSTPLLRMRLASMRVSTPCSAGTLWSESHLPSDLTAFQCEYVAEYSETIRPAMWISEDSKKDGRPYSSFSSSDGTP